jgi:hypothetical protein
MSGKTHLVSGVKFDSEGFPIFDSKYSMKLNVEDYNKSRNTHFSKASKQLYKDILKNDKLRSQFTDSK